MVERMGENDAIVTRFLDDADFQQTASEGQCQISGRVDP